jgi:hypothetical protein
MRLSFLIMLTACEPIKTLPDSATGEDTSDTGTAVPTFHYDINTAREAASLGWAEGMVNYAGYSGTGSPDGVYTADPVGNGESAFIYRIPWTAEGALIVEDAAEATISTGYLGPDKIGYEQGHFTAPDAAADVYDYEGAGIGYSFDSPPESGDLAAQAGMSIRGDVLNGYAARILWLGADGDGKVDDVVATQGRTDTSTYHGVIGIFFDAAGELDFVDADLVLDACQDIGDSRITYGAVDLALDVDGYLWATCPSGTYYRGTAEAWLLPFGDLSGAPDIQIKDVGGWTAEPDPAGGVWLGAQGGGYLGYASAKNRTAEGYYAPDDADSYFGAAPVTLRTSGGQTLLAVGMQARSVNPNFTYDTMGRFHVGDLNPRLDGSSSEADSALYLCDITDGHLIDADHCARYGPSEGAPCIGAVQGITEQDGKIYISSFGWLYGSGAGCGGSIFVLDGI